MSSNNEIRFRIWPELELKIQALLDRLKMKDEKELITYLINREYLKEVEING